MENTLFSNFALVIVLVLKISSLAADRRIQKQIWKAVTASPTRVFTV